MFTLIVAESAEQGAKAGPIITAGHMVLELVLLVGLAAGLTQVLSLPLVTACISIVGGAVMVWMGSTLIARAARGGWIRQQMRAHPRRMAPYADQARLPAIPTPAHCSVR